MADEFQSLTQAPQIRFALRELAPANLLYVAPGERLAVNVWSSQSIVPLEVHGRLLRPDGEVVPFRYDQRLVGNRGVEQYRFELAEGFLIALRAGSFNASLKRGQTWVQITLHRGGAVGEGLVLLVQGYISGNTILTWPTGQIDDAVAGPGYIQSLAGADPAAGAEISQTVVPGARWRLGSVAATLVTDATVAAREPHLVIDDGANVLFRVPPPTTLAASSTGLFVWARGQGYEKAATGVFTHGLGVLPPLLQGWRIRTITANLQAGDNWGAPRLWVEEWLEL